MATCLAPSSRRANPTLDVVFHRDLVCAWSHLVACRLESLRRQTGAWFTWRIRPFPARAGRAHLGANEIESTLRDIELVRREPDCPRIVPAPFAGAKPPGRGVRAMAAVEAAFFQSQRAGLPLDSRLRVALFESGQDVGSLEVIMELAESLRHVGLDPARLSRDLGGADEGRWRDRLADRRGEAMSRGILRAPAVQVGGRLLLGACSTDTYLEAVFDALASSLGAGSSGHLA